MWFLIAIVGGAIIGATQGALERRYGNWGFNLYNVIVGVLIIYGLYKWIKSRFPKKK